MCFLCAVKSSPSSLSNFVLLVKPLSAFIKPLANSFTESSNSLLYNVNTLAFPIPWPISMPNEPSGNELASKVTALSVKIQTISRPSNLNLNFLASVIIAVLSLLLQCTTSKRTPLALMAANPALSSSRRLFSLRIMHLGEATCRSMFTV